MGMLLRRREGYGKNITKSSDVNPAVKAEEKKSDNKKKSDKKATEEK